MQRKEDNSSLYHFVLLRGRAKKHNYPKQNKKKSILTIPGAQQSRIEAKSLEGHVVENTILLAKLKKKNYSQSICPL